MFELEEYSTGFHDGFLNKYAVCILNAFFTMENKNSQICMYAYCTL